MRLVEDFIILFGEFSLKGRTFDLLSLNDKIQFLLVSGILSPKSVQFCLVVCLIFFVASYLQLFVILFLCVCDPIFLESSLNHIFMTIKISGWQFNPEFLDNQENVGNLCLLKKIGKMSGIEKNPPAKYFFSTNTGGPTITRGYFYYHWRKIEPPSADFRSLFR